jgi:hypothetical protein
LPGTGKLKGIIDSRPERRDDLPAVPPCRIEGEPVTYTSTAKADKVRLHNFVDGAPVDATDGRTAPVIDPSLGEVYAEAPVSSAADVDVACKAAARAFESWRDSTPSDRQGYLLKLAAAMEERSEELIAVECRNTGKPIALTRSEEIPPCLDQIRFFAGAARVLEGRSAGEYLAGHTSWIRREPIGVSPARLLTLDTYWRGEAGTSVLMTSLALASTLGVDGVKLLMPWNVPPEERAERSALIGQVITEAEEFGLPVMVEPIALEMPRSPEAIAIEADGVRMASELGADIVKVAYPGDPETLAAWCREVEVPLVILGGPAGGGADELCVMVEEAVGAGAAGITIGRRVWQRPLLEASELLERLVKIVHSGGR